jgi:DNA-binding NarL/FixJ family response regulator/HPt (histidine-containing phosphotransfer) domain-containing protein
MKKFIIVDDHPAIRLAIRSALEATGSMQMAAEAADGPGGLAAIREYKPDLVILDLELPRLSGLDLIERLRRSQPETKVLVLSAQQESIFAVRTAKAGANGFMSKNAPMEAVVLALDAGMDECLTKPLSLQDLSAALHRHLGAGRPAEEAAPAPSAAGSQGPFDPLLLRGFSAGDLAIEIRFLEVLVRTNRADAEALRERALAGQWSEAAALAHKIKGAARMIDAAGVIRDCECFERACKAAATDPAGATAGLAALGASLDGLERGMVAELGRLKHDTAPAPAALPG